MTGTWNGSSMGSMDDTHLLNSYGFVFEHPNAAGHAKARKMTEFLDEIRGRNLLFMVTLKHIGLMPMQCSYIDHRSGKRVRWCWDRFSPVEVKT